MVDPTPERLAKLGRSDWPKEAHLMGNLEREHLCRQPRPLGDFLDTQREVNLRLERLHLRLSDDMLVSCRLYTGPTFIKCTPIEIEPLPHTLYVLLLMASGPISLRPPDNSILRGVHGRVPFFKHGMDSLCDGNLYPTTIHVTNRALNTLASLSKCQYVYRGVSGGLLPPEFNTPDEIDHFRGGVEFAFMSTTTSKEVAIDYAKASGNGLVFEIWMGMVDKGAEISVFSQYPHEAEICFPPLTALEVRGTRIDGSLTMVSVDARVNTTHFEHDASAELQHFKSHDHDFSGEINRIELGRLAREVVPTITDATLDAIFGAADVDGSGEISYDEFRAKCLPQLHEEEAELRERNKQAEEAMKRAEQEAHRREIAEAEERVAAEKQAQAQAAAEAAAQAAESKRAAEVASLRAAHHAETVLLTERHEAQVTKLREQHTKSVTKLEAEVASLKSCHAQELRALTDEQQRRVAKLEEQAVALRRSAESEAAALKDAHAGEIATLTESRDQQLGKLEAYIDSLKSTHACELTSLADAHSKQLAALVESHTADVAATDAAHSMRLSEMQSAHEAAATSLEHAHASAMAALRKGHEGAITSLEDAHAAEAAKMRKSHSEFEAKVEEERQRAIAELREVNTAAARKVEMARAAHAGEVASMKKAHQQLVSSLEGKVETIERKHVTAVKEWQEAVLSSKDQLDTFKAKVALDFRASVATEIEQRRKEMAITAAEVCLESIGAKAGDSPRGVTSSQKLLGNLSAFMERQSSPRPHPHSSGHSHASQLDISTLQSSNRLAAKKAAKTDAKFFAGAISIAEQHGSPRLRIEGWKAEAELLRPTASALHQRPAPHPADKAASAAPMETTSVLKVRSGCDPKSDIVVNSLAKGTILIVIKRETMEDKSVRGLVQLLNRLMNEPLGWITIVKADGTSPLVPSSKTDFEATSTSDGLFNRQLASALQQQPAPQQPTSTGGLFNRTTASPSPRPSSAGARYISPPATPCDSPRGQQPGQKLRPTAVSDRTRGAAASSPSPRVSATPPRLPLGVRWGDAR